MRSVDVTVQSRDRFHHPDKVYASELSMLEEETEGELVPPNTVLDPTYGAFRRAHAINDLLITSDSDDSPSSFVRFVAVTEDMVSLRRVWHRGLGIAMRGLTLEIEKGTGAVLRSGAMGQPLR